MTAYRFNPLTQIEDVITLPADWYCPMNPSSYDTVINCACCGKRLTFDESYTSLEITNILGLGYWVCGDCHWKEIDRRKGK